MKGRIVASLVSAGVPFFDLIRQPLPFKICIVKPSYVSMYPTLFECGNAEYGANIDCWLDHSLMSFTSEQAVVILDGCWQTVLKNIADLNVFLDEHDASSQKRFRPDFTAMFYKILVMKGEAKATLSDVMSCADELVKKFHEHAYKLFPRGCDSIPAVMTCNEQIQLFSISFYRGRFSQRLVHTYDVRGIEKRVEFIVDIFHILRWILSQTEPIEGFHLPPDVRLKTRNGHHVTLTSSGLLKEFDEHKLEDINMDVIRRIYELVLPNVEHGSINCKSVTITRVGSRLRDAMRVRGLSKADVYAQLQMSVEQLHLNGIAHCDICVDNIFVDSVEDGGRVFLGDLEYCRPSNEKPPSNIRRAIKKAKTAEQLDNMQLEVIKDELARL